MLCAVWAGKPPLRCDTVGSASLTSSCVVIPRNAHHDESRFTHMLIPARNAVAFPGCYIASPRRSGQLFLQRRPDNMGTSSGV
ncbi:hypothetical protein KCP74_13835 [Salmonella enterica subsp. enterica]|nr:hypothetical protein KCP74_13835 [Salmonella enterica subsp. enterica]